MSLRLSATPDELKSKFGSLNTKQDIADLLEVDVSRLNYYLYVSPRATRYKTFEIRKASGGTREISAPATALKIIQQKLNQVLQCVYKRRPPVYSFIHDYNIVKNARNHLRRQYVFNIDLKDFFPSITFPRIRGLFMAKPYTLNQVVATILAQICCFDSKLPQGAPTSPIVSNMICSKLDNELQRLARKYNCRYTRYADDITFSTQERAFPSALAAITVDGKLEVGDEVKHIIHQNWFDVNPDKVRLRKRNVCQVVTGIIVNNESPNVRRKYVRQIRAMLHAWEKYGVENAQKEFLNCYNHNKNRAPFRTPPLFKQIINGKLGFLGMVIGKNNPVYLRYWRQFKRLCLLEDYEKLMKSTNARQRGYLIENLLNRTFEFYEISAIPSFRRNKNGEQIDGGFDMGGWQYIVECRWRAKRAGIRDLDGLDGKVKRSGKSAKGFFLSINGWSTGLPNLMKQNPDKAIILMNGDDLHHVLKGNVNLQVLLEAKNQKLSLECEPFYGANQFIKDSKKA
ncbi:MAG: reverse transcriptase family protein [candidate division Zixibacteria bacterium]|nr:reverse transcriptase family protein [candidate division Zixibacteria bacterium]